MKEYFEVIIRKLSIDEIAVLGALLDKDATAAFKSIKRNELFNLSKLSVANFRKTMDKLTATQLIGVLTGGKDHKVYLTEYGSRAIQKSLEEADD